eukprot:TRINITY_DN411_c0_g1_i4.p1 TRINITY_DN411_c0_g1~~TRINITY_DN411_c0_g1_i4.p1  ORF type:complete len:174 (+),score=7.61 TRINITY_DN411_c0_g1_i4:510-1031(+)
MMCCCYCCTPVLRSAAMNFQSAAASALWRCCCNSNDVLLLLLHTSPPVASVAARTTRCAAASFPACTDLQRSFAATLLPQSRVFAKCCTCSVQQQRMRRMRLGAGEPFAHIGILHVLVGEGAVPAPRPAAGAPPQVAHTGEHNVVCGRIPVCVHAFPTSLRVCFMCFDRHSGC